MRLHKFFILVLCMSFILSGCGFKDIDKRFFVVGMGIDKANNPNILYKVTLKLAIPDIDPKKGMSQFITFTEESNNIAEVVQRIKSKTDKELEFGHLKIIMFGKDLAANDLRPAMDWLIRRRDIQKIALMGIGDPSAEDVLEKKLDFERVPSDALLLSLEGTGTESNYITLSYLFDFNRRKSELGLDPLLPVIKTDKNNFNINQLALFEKEKNLKIKIILSPKETLLYNLISTKNNRAILNINTQDGNFIFDVINIKHNYKIEKSNEKSPEMKFNLRISGIIEESLKPVNPKDLKKYEEAASNVLKNQVLELLKKIQSENIDPIGFGLYYRSTSWKNDTKWEDWKKIYPNLNFTVQVDVKLESTGLIK